MVRAGVVTFRSKLGLFRVRTLAKTTRGWVYKKTPGADWETTGVPRSLCRGVIQAQIAQVHLRFMAAQ